MYISRFSSWCDNQFIIQEYCWFYMEILNIHSFFKNPNPFFVLIYISLIWRYTYFKLILFKIHLAKDSNCLDFIVQNGDLLSYNMESRQNTTFLPGVLLYIINIILFWLISSKENNILQYIIFSLRTNSWSHQLFWWNTSLLQNYRLFIWYTLNK